MVAAVDLLGVRACRRLPVLLGLLSSLCFGMAAASANAASVGAASAPAGPRSGGAEFGEPVGHAARQPVAAVFRVSPRRLTEGHAPKIAVRIEQHGVDSVVARIDFSPVGGRGKAIKLDLGHLRTGRLVHPSWPSSVTLPAGRYLVRVHARDPIGATLRRTHAAGGRAYLTVKARPKRKKANKKTSAPAPTPTPTPTPTPAPVPTPAPTAGGVFPVQGPHSFGGDDARFGAGRPGHIHQGQDVVAAEGLPIVAPVAGSIVAVDYQASGAGYYLVQDTLDGRSFFFAHCQKDSFGVALGQVVTAGQALCRVGHTGDASGPHLHFEIWLNGWRRDKTSYPIDPLSQLQAWDH